MNAVEIEETVSQLAEAPFDPEEFPFAFLEAFGNKTTTIKKLRSQSNSSNKSDVGGVLQRNNIHLKVCTEGEVAATLTALRESPATTKQKAKFILATDGKNLEAENLVDGETVACAYPDFHDHFGFFLPLAGITTVKQIRENAFDIKATARLNRLYVELLKDNPEWDTAERREEMNHFMARLIFCFFAEDTNIFCRENLFTDTVARMSASDSSNTHEVLSEIFRAMATPIKQRKAIAIRNWANDFPYANGGLFGPHPLAPSPKTGEGGPEVGEGGPEAAVSPLSRSGRGAGGEGLKNARGEGVPRFSRIARSYLLHVGNLDWTKINPDIFGSMIQAVADDEERGALGMHYTSVPNILKVLNPLFLDDLREQLENAGDNARKLLNLRKRMARIRVFDPACGSGNFLVIAYKEMRQIEAEINRRRGEPDIKSEIPLTNFRGIEIRHFSCEIARLALIIAEYQCDVVHRGQQLALAEFLPLKADNWITCGNALRLDWLSICPPTGTDVKVLREDADLFSEPEAAAEVEFENEGGETYLCGNPPYLGKGKKDTAQLDDMRFVLEHYTKKYGYVDYVGCWFIRAAEYLQCTRASVALVATNSICQGRQLPQLWPHVLRQNVEIFFAHHSFKWSNSAANNAGVTCVIIGISTINQNRSKHINYGEFSRVVSNINAYLIDGENIYIESVPKPLSDTVSTMLTGSVPNDGGNLILSQEDTSNLVSLNQSCHRFIHPFFGSQDFLQGHIRNCLVIKDEDVETAKTIPEINRRLDEISRLRAVSKKKETRDLLAAVPHRFQHRGEIPCRCAIIVPSVSSERREWFPVGLLPAGTVISNLAFMIVDGPLFNLGLLSSRLHLVWIATVCGKLKTDFRYSNTLGWNTFPVPTLTEQNKTDLTRCAEDILLAREHYFPATIADMYDPNRMDTEFPLVRQAHDRNDEVLERIYIGRRFKNDTERLEKLFEMYTKMTAK
ncbi:MAG: DNA methyltransferase [Leptolyngbyaceae bacterium]|nr:DNA methyltransferase [Leptolyngbyaceae bacterium]